MKPVDFKREVEAEEDQRPHERRKERPSWMLVLASRRTSIPLSVSASVEDAQEEAVQNPTYQSVLPNLISQRPQSGLWHHCIVSLQTPSSCSGTLYLGSAWSFGTVLVTEYVLNGETWLPGFRPWAYSSLLGYGLAAKFRNGDRKTKETVLGCPK